MTSKQYKHYTTPQRSTLNTCRRLNKICSIWQRIRYLDKSYSEKEVAAVQNKIVEQWTVNKWFVLASLIVLLWNFYISDQHVNCWPDSAINRYTFVCYLKIVFELLQLRCHLQPYMCYYLCVFLHWNYKEQISRYFCRSFSVCYHLWKVRRLPSSGGHVGCVKKTTMFELHERVLCHFLHAFRLIIWGALKCAPSFERKSSYS